MKAKQLKETYINTLVDSMSMEDLQQYVANDMAQKYGHAQLVWYALNGKRVVEGEYTDKD